MRVSIGLLVLVISLFCSILSSTFQCANASSSEEETAATAVLEEETTKASATKSDDEATTTSTTTTTEEEVLDLDDPNNNNVISETDKNALSEEDSIPAGEEESCSLDETNVTTSSSNNSINDDNNNTVMEEEDGNASKVTEAPVQIGPFIDLLGETLLSLEMVDERSAKLHEHYTNAALSGKKVIGLYFSADWCGPCRQFTPDLVNFYNRMNSREGKKDQFEIVWISRCRDYESFGQYFTQMNWLAMQPEDAMGARGQHLADKYKVKGIPSLVLLDEVGTVITLEGRNKIPTDKAGIGFPWRNPLAQAYINLVPKSLRLIVKTQIDIAKEQFIDKFKQFVVAAQTKMTTPRAA